MQLNVIFLDLKHFNFQPWHCNTLKVLLTQQVCHLQMQERVTILSLLKTAFPQKEKKELS